jgi:putative spermidine/putrescine transport system ATP-binding protein
MIAECEIVSSGDARICSDVAVELPPVANRTGVMFQNHPPLRHLTALDNVAFSLDMRGVAERARPARARELPALVRMEGHADELPARLSGGGQQPRVAPRAFVTESSLLLPDERCRRPTRRRRHSCHCARKRHWLARGRGDGRQGVIAGSG